jgi:hypothetical protein
MIQPSPQAKVFLEEVVDDAHELLIVLSAEVDVLEASRATWDGGSLLSKQSSEVHTLGSNVLNSHG